MDKTTQDMKVGPLNSDYTRGYLDGKKAGATVENERSESIRLQLEAQNANVEILLAQKNDLMERAQPIIDALDQFISYHETGLLPARHVYEKAVAAREQWKAGKENLSTKSFNVDEVQSMLVDFALAYHKSTNKDIANNAAEYIHDMLTNPTK